MVAARSDKLLPFRSARRIDYSAGAPTKEHWVRLAASWIKADAKAKSRSTELAPSDSETAAGESFSDG
jgi:hypothetical protein